MNVIKSFGRRLLMMAGVGMMVAGAMMMVTPGEVYADIIKEGKTEACEISIFGLRPWYAGLVTMDKNNHCVVGTPTEQTLPAFIWTVVLNVLFDMFSLLGFVTLGFVILGGYWYLRSGGDPALVARGKKTIQAAIIGTVIALLAAVITNFITMVLTTSGGN